MPGPSVTSSGTRVAEPPSALIWSSTASSPPTVRATSTQCAPSRAYASAVAAPRPREAPVISARRPARRPAGAAPTREASGRLDEQGELAVLDSQLVVERDRVVAGEAGVAEGRLVGITAGLAHGAVESVDRHEGQRIDLDELRHAGDVVVRGQELVALGRVDAVETRIGRGRRGDAHMHLASAGLAHHLDDLHRGGAAHDRIINQDHALAVDQAAVGVVLQAHAEMADSVDRFDEGAADIVVADDAELE